MLAQSNPLSKSQLIVAINYDLGDAQRKQTSSAFILADCAQPIDRIGELLQDMPPFIDTAFCLDRREFHCLVFENPLALFTRSANIDDCFEELRQHLSSRRASVLCAGGVIYVPPARIQNERGASALAYDQALCNLHESRRRDGKLIISSIAEFIPRDLLC